MIEDEQRLCRVCFTGHRPEKIHTNTENVKSALQREIMTAIREGKTSFISGMSRGVDLWAAEIVLALKETNPDIRLVCAIPFKGFETRWSAAWQHQYTEILKKADEVHFICSGFSYYSYQARNVWMVNHASRVIAVWNGEKGGTKNTILYAEKSGVNVVNVWNVLT